MTHEELFDDNQRPTKLPRHTPEPWGVNKGGAFNLERWGAIERRWLDPEMNPEEQLQVETIAEVCDGDPKANIGEADAWRIVDCVNAMANIYSPAELVRAAKAALSALETPDDLTKEEMGYVIEDLAHALREVFKKEDTDEQV